jgi:hypothetical protein
MDPKVHRRKEDATRGLGDIGMPAIEQNRNMMVPMQEDQGFLMNDNEKRVQKFPVEVA